MGSGKEGLNGDVSGSNAGYESASEVLSKWKRQGNIDKWRERFGVDSESHQNPSFK